MLNRRRILRGIYLVIFIQAIGTLVTSQTQQDQDENGEEKDEHQDPVFPELLA